MHTERVVEWRKSAAAWELRKVVTALVTATLVTRSGQHVRRVGAVRRCRSPKSLGREAVGVRARRAVRMPVTSQGVREHRQRQQEAKRRNSLRGPATPVITHLIDHGVYASAASSADA